MSTEDLSTARAHWRIDQHDERLRDGAATFGALRKEVADVKDHVASRERSVLWWVATAALAAILSVGALVYGIGQKSEQAEATGRGLLETRAAVAELSTKVSDINVALIRTAAALEALTERTRTQDAELQRLRDKAKR